MRPVDFGAFVDELATRLGPRRSCRSSARALAAEDKSRGGVFDPVTEADRAGEVVMRALIADALPGPWRSLGEEFGSERDGRRIRLGARSDRRHPRLHLRPAGLGHADRPDCATAAPVYGMMHQPFIGERFSGDGGEARYRRAARRAARCAPAPCADLAEATLMTTSPALFEGEQIGRLSRASRSEVRLARYGCDCYAYCMLAAGHVDSSSRAGLKPYDIVALIPIIEGAGGVVTTWDGGSAAEGGAHRRLPATGAA